RERARQDLLEQMNTDSGCLFAEYSAFLRRLKSKLRNTAMKFGEAGAEIWVPDGADEATALGRVTHMGIGAHCDDIEIMCLEGVLAGFGNAEKWFMAAIVTD